MPDQRLATLFYVAGLGLTRDPYLMVSDTNMWVNVGRNQFHLPNGPAQVLRGHTGIVISGREALLDRLAAVAPKLKTRSFRSARTTTMSRPPVRGATACAATSRTPTRFGRISLGIPYVEFDVPVGTTKAICDSIRRSWACRPN